MSNKGFFCVLLNEMKSDQENKSIQIKHKLHLEIHNLSLVKLF